MTTRPDQPRPRDFVTAFVALGTLILGIPALAQLLTGGI